MSERFIVSNTGDKRLVLVQVEDEFSTDVEVFTGDRVKEAEQYAIAIIRQFLVGYCGLQLENQPKFKTLEEAKNFLDRQKLGVDTVAPKVYFIRPTVNNGTHVSWRVQRAIKDGFMKVRKGKEV